MSKRGRPPRALNISAMGETQVDIKEQTPLNHKIAEEGEQESPEQKALREAQERLNSYLSEELELYSSQDPHSVINPSYLQGELPVSESTNLSPLSAAVFEQHTPQGNYTHDTRMDDIRGFVNYLNEHDKACFWLVDENYPFRIPLELNEFTLMGMISIKRTVSRVINPHPMYGQSLPFEEIHSRCFIIDVLPIPENAHNQEAFRFRRECMEEIHNHPTVKQKKVFWNDKGVVYLHDWDYKYILDGIEQFLKT